MKNLFIAIGLLISTISYGQSDTLNPTSKIKEVTVFFSGAQINREAKLRLSAGKHLLLFDRLPEEINPQSIQVKGFDNLQILSVKHQLNYKDQGKKSVQEEGIHDEIEQQKIDIQHANNELNVLRTEEQLLLDNRTIVAGKEGTSAQTLTEVANFYRTRLSKIKKQQLDLQVNLKKMQEELNDLHKKLNKIVVYNRRTYSQILVSIDCKQTVNSTLNFTYFITSAGWTPWYDFRVKDVASPLSIVYNADVYQSSGEDWENASIVLSSGDPTLSGNKPELQKFYLGQPTPITKRNNSKAPATLIGRVFDSKSGEAVPYANIMLMQGNRQVIGTVTDANGQYTIKPINPGNYVLKVSFLGYKTQSINGIYLNANQTQIKDVALQNSTIELQEVVVAYDDLRQQRFNTRGNPVKSGYAEKKSAPINTTGSRVNAEELFINGVTQQSSIRKETNLISNAIKQGATDLEYRIKIPYTILSDGEDYNLKIKETKVSADYLYYAVPKLEQNAFLTAQLTDWNQLNLLSGKINIYYEGTFKSESHLDIEKADDTLSISLGRDKGIAITRKLDETLTEKKRLGKNVKETVAWKIAVRNNKSVPIHIIVEDQYPLVNRDIFKVNLSESSNAVIDKKEGHLEWEFQLQPDNKKELRFGYTAEYPKNINFIR